MAVKERGVLYMVWGDKVKAPLARSIDSVKEIHPELPIEIVEFSGGGHANKSKMLDCTPFRQTLFLDVDTVVLGRLDYGFERAERAGLACCINENPWAARYRALEGDMVEYNTGVLFFTAAARPVFEGWAALRAEIDTTLTYLKDGEVHQTDNNDQGYFAAAVDRTGTVPFVLPLNWNFRPRWHRAFFGPVKVWHDYAEVWPKLKQLNALYQRPGSLFSFHEVRLPKGSGAR
jgi:hypothetical protein